MFGPQRPNLLQPSLCDRCLSLVLTLVALIGSTACWGPGAERESDREAIGAAFTEFRDAALVGDGKRAASLASSSTLEFLESLRQLALSASREEVEAQRAFAQYFVLTLRLLATQEEVEVMRPEDVFAFGVKQKVYASFYLPDSQLVDLEIAGETATGWHAKGENAVHRTYREHFVREPDVGWRLDLLAYFDAFSASIEENAIARKASASEAVQAMVEVFNGRSLYPRHLRPLRADLYAGDGGIR